ncbi:exosome complex component RRP43-like [Condylostylus longicornis]|uniref:exosome complex component RRP43-like n=1 Tax=Condylostylus longicornis TaxID=2530218 RepID=UPI00244E4970|nr:exosome complex component RRP43-like [Condylostylus longicornis]
MAEQYKLIYPVKYYRDYLINDIRPDGREFDKFRPIALNIGSINTADGSAIVKIGNTNIVCGIRAELAKPKAETPESGFLVPSIELPPICSKKYRENDSSFKIANKDADVLTCTLYDILTNARCVDLKELCICKERLVWAIYLDIVCLNHDGCVLDTALVAALAALKNLTLPKIDYDADINSISVNVEERSKIKINSLPVATTLMVFDDNIIVTDPTSEEEDLSSTMITIAICNSDVCFVFKPGGTPFSQNQMEICTNRALARESYILELLNNAKAGNLNLKE